MKNKHDFFMRVGRSVRTYMQKELLPKWNYLPDFTDCCGHASVILFKRLKQLGYKPKIVESRNHYFVVCDGYLVDVTASQFGQPKICVQNYAKIKKIIEKGERNLDFWKEEHVSDRLTGNLKCLITEIHNTIRSK